MKKLISLLKATMKNNLNLFRLNANKKSSKINKIMIPIALAAVVMLSIGMYAYMIAKALPSELRYIMLTLFIIFTTLMTFIEGIYKSQGILFDAKDNDLLFSLPIEKSKILLARVFKLISFQFLYNVLFMLPAFIVYIILQNPGVEFYLISILMLFLLPIIPTILSCIIGYVVKEISGKFKFKKTLQTILTMAVFMVIFFLSYNLEPFIKNIAQDAQNINEILLKIYYPAGLFINLISNFKIMDLIMLLLVNIIPMILFIYIASISYFKIISMESCKSIKKDKKEVKTKVLKANSQLGALIRKETKRFFSSPIYIFNTSFGVVLMFVLTIGLCVNLDGLVGIILKGENIAIETSTVIQFLPKVFYGLVIFITCMTSITSSSISLEGKSFNITKSLPVSEKKVFLSKIIASDIIAIPLIIVSDIIFIAKFRIEIIDTICILAASIILPTLTAILGLIVNLKYPKMNAKSDTEVVKQSMSPVISILTGMIIAILSVLAIFMLISKISINVIMISEILIFLIITIVLYRILNRYGIKKFREINI